jgi:hypothetical protein
LLAIEPMKGLDCLGSISGAGVDILRVTWIEVIKTETDGAIAAWLERSPADSGFEVSRQHGFSGDGGKAGDGGFF